MRWRSRSKFATSRIVAMSPLPDANAALATSSTTTRFGSDHVCMWSTRSLSSRSLASAPARSATTPHGSPRCPPTPALWPSARSIRPARPVLRRRTPRWAGRATKAILSRCRSSARKPWSERASRILLKRASVNRLGASDLRSSEVVWPTRAFRRTRSQSAPSANSASVNGSLPMPHHPPEGSFKVSFIEAFKIEHFIYSQATPGTVQSRTPKAMLPCIREADWKRRGDPKFRLPPRGVSEGFKLGNPVGPFPERRERNTERPSLGGD